MSNFVNLILDKDTGKIFAKKVAGAGGPVPPIGLIHNQIAPSTLWTIIHNRNTKNLVAQIYDDNDELIIPDKIIIVDNNTINIEFTAAITGSARVLFFFF